MKCYRYSKETRICYLGVEQVVHLRFRFFWALVRKNLIKGRKDRGPFILTYEADYSTSNLPINNRAFGNSEDAKDAKLHI